MKLNFTKMHGCGNDYIYFNCFNQAIENPEGLSVRLSDRHFGIGGDGVVLICPSEVADAKMRMFNLDGSEGKMCGNASRCIAKYMFENGIVDRDEMTIETLSGIKTVKVFVQNGEVSSACVNMGKAELAPAQIPVKLDGSAVVDRPVLIGEKEYHITCVSMGNPHCVVFMDNVDMLDIEAVGRCLKTISSFPNVSIRSLSR